MTWEPGELHLVYTLLKKEEERLAVPLLKLLRKIEKELYQTLSITEIEELAGLTVYREQKIEKNL